MSYVQDVFVQELTKSNFVKPMEMHYTLHGVRKKWDLLKIHDSVAILIYNVTRKVVILVKQFRPAVFYGAIPACDSKGQIDVSKYDPKMGLTLELCAGIVDKNKSLEEIARDEILEECGYSVPVASLQRVVQYRSSVGTSGDKQTVFFVEVTDEMRVSQGGGNIEEGEFIEVVEMTIPEVKKLLDGPEVLSPGGFLFALTWFLHNKGPFE